MSEPTKEERKNMEKWLKKGAKERRKALVRDVLHKKPLI